MRINNILCVPVLGVMAGCGGGSGNPAGTPAGAGSGGGRYVQYAVVVVTGDSASGLQPYAGAAEVDYDSAGYYAPTFKLGECDQVYDSTISTNGVADATEISCSVSAPSGSPATGSSVALKVLFKGKPSAGLEITLASPSLVRAYLQLFDANGRQADFPQDTRGSFSDLSLKIDSVKAIPLVAPSIPFTRYIIDAEAHATMTDPQEAPGTASVSMTMSANSPISGAPDGGAVVAGTCSDLTACCNAITDAIAKTTCLQLETAYQGMVGGGYTQTQADFACSTFLELERKGTLCP